MTSRIRLQAETPVLLSGFYLWRFHGYHKRFYQRTNRWAADSLFAADPGGAVSAGALRRGGSAGGGQIRGDGRRLRRGCRFADHDDRHRSHQLPRHGQHDPAGAEAGDARREGLRQRDRREHRFFRSGGACADPAAAASIRCAGPAHERAGGGLPGDPAVYRHLWRREPCHCGIQRAGQRDARPGRFPDATDDSGDRLRGQHRGGSAAGGGLSSWRCRGGHRHRRGAAHQRSRVLPRAASARPAVSLFPAGCPL